MVYNKKKCVEEIEIVIERNQDVQKQEDVELQDAIHIVVEPYH